MSLYTITFNDRAVEALPPDKRYSNHVKWWQSVVNVIQYLHTDLLIDYRSGSDYPQWSNLVTYSKGNRVIFAEKVYESLIDSNTEKPDSSINWRVYQTSFIGVEERISYTTQKLVLEYAVNKRFNTTFRQPDSVSDIYITTNTPTIGVFICGEIEYESSQVYSNTSSEFVINGYTFTGFTNFTVNIPTAVYDSVSSDVTAREKIFRNYIDRYVAAGIIYKIATY